MKIIVLNGSPKGNTSVTMQYIGYIQKHFKQHELKIINIAQTIKQIEEKPDFFENIIDEIETSDGVIWAFPLYILVVIAQYKRFIELIFERNKTAAFKGKYTALLATSIHFYDHTAINYMNGICDDLDMNYVDYLSLQMTDLHKADIRKTVLQFAENYFSAIENKRFTFKNYNKISYTPIQYQPSPATNKTAISDKKVVVITDSLENNNLTKMIEQFRNAFLAKPELINLQDIDIKGGCLGCLKCGYDYECAYTGKDGYIDFYNNKVKTADILIFAGTIRDRYLSSTWKTFFDRAFFNTHTPTLSGKQLGFILSGPLKQLPNLRQVLEGYEQFQMMHLVGFATDEYKTSAEIDKALYHLANESLKCSLINYTKPLTSLGVSSWKIFRDEIWGELRFPFIADHKAYKKLKIYDFPHKNYKSRIGNFIFTLMIKFPRFRKEIYSNRIKTAMIASLKAIVEHPNM